MNATRTILLIGVSMLALNDQVNAQGGTSGAAKSQTAAFKSLVGTQWSGSEDLEGFGKLTFQFQNDNKAIMIDTSGKSQGTYSVNGNEISILFNNGKVAYIGKISGKTLSGTAANSKEVTWKFRVTQDGGNVKNPAPQGQVGGINNEGTDSSGPPPTGPGAGQGPGSGPGAAQKPAHEALFDILNKLRFEPKVITPDIGDPYCQVKLKDKDGWNFVVEVKNNKGIWLIATLNKTPAGKLDPEKLLRLLEANDGISPCFFMYRAADRRLCLKLEVVQATEQGIMGDIQTLTNAVRLTHALWNTANWGKEEAD